MRVVLFLATWAALLLPAAQASAETAAEKAMAKQIGRELKESGQLRDYRIGVKYQDGVVWLGGNVANANQRDTAVRLTQQMEGVARVISQLDYPGNPEFAPQNPNNFNATGPTYQASAQMGRSPVVHAYSNEPPAQPMRPTLTQAARQPRNVAARSRGNMPLPSRPAAGSIGPVRQASAQGVQQAAGPYYAGDCPPGAYGGAGAMGQPPMPAGFVPHGMGRGPSYENAAMPGYAWPSYAAYPNYAALTYPKQYSPTAWPYIGPFYPYPQVPLAWRKVSLEWDDGWWFLDFSAHNSSH